MDNHIKSIDVYFRLLAVCPETDEDICWDVDLDTFNKSKSNWWGCGEVPISESNVFEHGSRHLTVFKWIDASHRHELDNNFERY